MILELVGWICSICSICVVVSFCTLTFTLSPLTPHLCCLPFPPSLAWSFSSLIYVSIPLSFLSFSGIPPLGPSRSAPPPKHSLILLSTFLPSSPHFSPIPTPFHVHALCMCNLLTKNDLCGLHPSFPTQTLPPPATHRREKQLVKKQRWKVH